MNEKNGKEINLLDLLGLVFHKVKLFFLRLFDSISYLLGHCYRYKWVMVVVILLALAAGQYDARKSNRSYKAGAMVYVNGSTSFEVKSILSQLENANPLEKSLSLEKKLKLTDSVARSINEIRAFHVIDYNRDSIPNVVDFKNSHSKRDTTNVYHNRILYLQIKTYNINNVPLIEQSILDYVNNNTFVLAKFRTDVESFKAEIDICNRELQRIDSLAKVSYFKEDKSTLKLNDNSLIIGEQRKQLFYYDMFELQKRKRKAEMELAQFVNPIVIPGGLVVQPQAINNRLSNAVVSGFVGLLVALLLTFIIRYSIVVVAWLDRKSKNDN